MIMLSVCGYVLRKCARKRRRLLICILIILILTLGKAIFHQRDIRDENFGGSFLNWVETQEASSVKVNSNVASKEKQQHQRLPASKQAGEPLNSVILNLTGMQSHDLKVLEDLHPLLEPGISHKEAENLFYIYISQLEVECKPTTRLGNQGDGGWTICISPDFQPKYNDCLIYSFGINYDFSFDDAAASTYSCEVHSFDPSMRNVTDQKRSSNVWFHQVGIGSNNIVADYQGWRLMTLKSLLQTYHHLRRTIDVLKLDIDYNEWSVLPTIFDEGVLASVKQVVIEIHTPEVYAINRAADRHDYIQMYTTLARFKNFGLMKSYYHGNPAAKFFSANTGHLRFCCYELTYINSNFLKVD